MTLTLYRLASDGAGAPTTRAEMGSYTDRVELEPISLTPSVSRIRTDNPAPYQDITRKPDTGSGGGRYILRAYMEDPSPGSGTPIPALQRLVSWQKTDNTSDSYRHGLIGFQNDYRPEFDVVPSADTGYKLMEVAVEQDMTYPGMVVVVLTLDLGGAVDNLGARLP